MTIKVDGLYSSDPHLFLIERFLKGIINVDVSNLGGE